jgi:hypothetical protein
MSGQYVRYPNHVRCAISCLVGGISLLQPVLTREQVNQEKKETYMSKTLSRKGLAFGALVALGSTLFAGAPAQANADGPLTLLPNGGAVATATYKSIIGAGITLTSDLDASKQAIEVTATQPAQTIADCSPEEPGDQPCTVPSQTYVVTPAVDPLAEAYYMISNPDGAAIEITLTGSIEGGGDFYTYASNGTATNRTADYLTTADPGYVDITGSNSFKTNATKLAVRSTVGGTAGDRSVAPIKIDALSESATSAIELEVTSWADYDVVDGKISNGEYKSATQEVVLLPAASVPTTTKMSATTARGGNTVAATVSLGAGVNPHAVVAANRLGVVFFENGAEVNINEDGDSTVVSGGLEYKLPSVNATTGAISVSATRQAANLISAGYSARTVYLYNNGDDDIYMGPRSVVLDLTDGTNATVKSAKTVFTESDNVAVVSGNNALVREGTKSLTVVGQITKDTAAGNTTQIDYKSAGVRVRATVTGSTINEDEGTEITVTGSTTEIVEAGDSIVVFGFTDSNGQFPITINSTTGENADEVTVEFDARLADGTYVGVSAEDIKWETPELETEVEVSPSEFLTGETINVTLTAVDQFGVGIDQTENGRVSIRVDAYVGGAVKTSTYSETKATTSGAASFSFANFATAGSNQEIQIQILEASAPLAGSTQYLTVYNNVATSAIAVSDVFENRVQYVDYVTGKTTDAAVAKAATDAIAAFTDGAANTEFALIVGTALDANNAGQPGVPVTIAAEGVLFHDLETKTIAKDSITVIANGQGFFDVQALSQKVNAAGATVTITAGGVSETTLLKTYLPNSIAPANLKFSWALPATIVKDTTYSVAASLTDVWGNPIRTLDTTGALDVTAEGALQVNGTDSITRNFSASGQSTFFIRSVATIGGPGSLNAALESGIEYATGKAGAAAGSVTATETVITTDVTTTSWDERLWSGALAVTVDVLDKAPAPTGKVNVGSFNGKLVVYAAGLDGAKISWKVAGRWGTAVASGNLLNRFDRPVGASGVNVIVEIYVNGVKQLTKTVLTR